MLGFCGWQIGSFIANDHLLWWSLGLHFFLFFIFYILPSRLNQGKYRTTSVVEHKVIHFTSLAFKIAIPIGHLIVK